MRLWLKQSEVMTSIACHVAGLWQIVSNFAGAAGALSGPVAIIAVGADAARADSAGLFQFAALVNVNLAVVNILPLPVGWLWPRAVVAC